MTLRSALPIEMPADQKMPADQTDPKFSLALVTNREF